MNLRNFFRRKRPQTAASDVKTQNWVLSYPKSGRTWLRVMIGRVFVHHYRLSEDQIFDEKTMALAAGLPPVDFSHDETSNSEGRHIDNLSPTKESYAGKHVLLLVRDPRDVVVSCFFQATRRKSRYEGDIHTFIRSETHGIKKIIRYFQIWETNQSVPASFTLLKYEDMHNDSQTSLRSALNFMGAADVPDELIEEAIEFSSFEKMKEMERSNSLKNKKLRPGDKNDPESFKVRKGKIGGYEEYLDDDDIAYCGEALREMDCPFGYR
jgi:hypothetical protein